MNNIISMNKILKNKQPYNDNSFCFVYFLLKDDKVVYVGKTINGLFRIREHSVDKEFDSFCMLKVDKNKLLDIEADNIFKYKPIYNRTIGQGYYFDRKKKVFYSKNSKVAKEKNELKKLLSSINKDGIKKTVTIMESGFVYESISDFAKSINVSPSYVTHSIRRGNYCGGYVVKNTKNGIVAETL